MIEHKCDVTSVFECKIVLIIIVNAQMPYTTLVSPNPNIVVGTKKNRLIETVPLSTLTHVYIDG